MKLTASLKSACFWLALTALACLWAINVDAAKKKEPIAAAPAPKIESTKEFPDWEVTQDACLGLQMPILFKEQRRLLPMKCCPDLTDPTKKQFPYTCELGPWVKDQSRLPEPVPPQVEAPAKKKAKPKPKAEEPPAPKG